MAHSSNTLIGRRQLDFLYWHGVSKMRMAEFEGAGRIFKLLQAVQPDRSDAALGYAYCLVRVGQWEQAARIVGALRRRPLKPEELGLLGRLHRRCEFERSRHAARHKALTQRPQAGAVNQPHTLGDNGMARSALEVAA